MTSEILTKSGVHPWKVDDAARQKVLEAMSPTEPPSWEVIKTLMIEKYRFSPVEIMYQIGLIEDRHKISVRDFILSTNTQLAQEKELPEAYMWIEAVILKEYFSSILNPLSSILNSIDVLWMASNSYSAYERELESGRKTGRS